MAQYATKNCTQCVCALTQISTHICGTFVCSDVCDLSESRECKQSSVAVRVPRAEVAREPYTSTGQRSAVSVLAQSAFCVEEMIQWGDGQ